MKSTVETLSPTRVRLDIEVPYADLTEALVISWIPENQIDSAQSCVQGQIDSLITPPVSPQNTALPWSA